MIRVSVEVKGSADPSRLTVLAANIDQALRLVSWRYPGVEARVLFPIDPESFFVTEPVRASSPGLVEGIPA